jgi:hypothetical protein
MRRTAWVIVAIGVALVAGCTSGGNDSSTPVPGTLTLTMSTGNTGDGALQIEVAGAPIDTIEARAGYAGYSYRTAANGFRIIVAGDIVPGPVATIHVPDIHKAASYLATVQKGTDGSTYAIRSGGGYLITVAP